MSPRDIKPGQFVRCGNEQWTVLDKAPGASMWWLHRQHEGEWQTEKAHSSGLELISQGEREPEAVGA